MGKRKPRGRRQVSANRSTVDRRSFVHEHAGPAMMQAVVEGNVEALEWVLQLQGVNPNCRDELGRTPLHQAASEGNDDCAKKIILHGGDVSAKDNDGWTPLHFAAFRGHTEMVPFFAQRGAPVDPVDRDMMTPLHVAAFNGQAGAVAKLAHYGAKVNLRASQDWTALHMAAGNGHAAAVRALLQAGADQTMQKEPQGTALHLACRQGHTDVASVLLDMGADLRARDSRKRTPLQVASDGSPNLRRVLLLSMRASNLSLDEVYGRAPTRLTLPSQAPSRPRMATLAATAPAAVSGGRESSVSAPPRPVAPQDLSQFRPLKPTPPAPSRPPPVAPQKAGSRHQSPAPRFQSPVPQRQPPAPGQQPQSQRNQSPARRNQSPAPRGHRKKASFSHKGSKELPPVPQQRARPSKTRKQAEEAVTEPALPQKEEEPVMMASDAGMSPAIAPMPLEEFPANTSPVSKMQNVPPPSSPRPVRLTPNRPISLLEALSPMDKSIIDLHKAIDEENVQKESTISTAAELEQLLKELVPPGTVRVDETLIALLNADEEYFLSHLPESSDADALSVDMQKATVRHKVTQLINELECGSTKGEISNSLKDLVALVAPATASSSTTRRLKASGSAVNIASEEHRVSLYSRPLSREREEDLCQSDDSMEEDEDETARKELFQAREYCGWLQTALEDQREPFIDKFYGALYPLYTRLKARKHALHDPDPALVASVELSRSLLRQCEDEFGHLLSVVECSDGETSSDDGEGDFEETTANEEELLGAW